MASDWDAAEMHGTAAALTEQLWPVGKITNDLKRLGEAREWIQRQERPSSGRFYYFVEHDDEDVTEQQFRELATSWQTETAGVSSIIDIVLNQNYQRIIGLGRPALPYILRAVAEKPDHWFWALHSITGANPTSPKDAGNVKEMAKAWLEWASQEGLSW